MTHVMTPEILALQTGFPVEMWRDAENTLGPYYWPLLWRDVASISARIGTTPAAIAASIISAIDQEHAS